MAKVRCSIELEPRTLNVVQLNYAREMAADVIQNSVESSIEASAICIEEMRPMGSMKEMEERVIIIDEEGEHQQNKLVELRDNQEAPPPICEGIICKCLYAAAEIETPDPEKLKEPLSAPF